MTDVEMWNLLVGFFAPLVISVVQQPSWSPRARTLVAACLSGVAGVVTAFLAGDYTGRSLVSGTLVTLVVSLTMYQRFWKPVGVADRIEVATSPGSSAPPVEPPVEPPAPGWSAGPAEPEPDRSQVVVVRPEPEPHVESESDPGEEVYVPRHSAEVEEMRREVRQRVAARAPFRTVRPVLTSRPTPSGRRRQV